jgi:2-dehydro-3-deoxyphosphogluconate aldolase/(4S)-4-hydroxy-2-oxoglutarate aldolase
VFEVFEKIMTIGIVPEIDPKSEEQALAFLEAISRAGLGCAKIAMRSEGAEDLLRKARQQFPQLLIGAGTILSVLKGEAAMHAGAQFLTSPGFDFDLVDWCFEHSLPIIPSVTTPSEIMHVMKTGLRLVQFFPVEAIGGVPVLRSISAPFPEMRYIAAGGINPFNLESYLRLPIVAGVTGTWISAPGMTKDPDWAAVEALARSAVETVKKIRG